MHAASVHAVTMHAITVTVHAATVHVLTGYGVSIATETCLWPAQPGYSCPS